MDGTGINQGKATVLTWLCSLFSQTEVCDSFSSAKEGRGLDETRRDDENIMLLATRLPERVQIENSNFANSKDPLRPQSSEQLANKAYFKFHGWPIIGLTSRLEGSQHVAKTAKMAFWEMHAPQCCKCLYRYCLLSH